MSGRWIFVDRSVHNEQLLAFSVLRPYDESLHLQTAPREGVGRGPLVSTMMGVLELMYGVSEPRALARVF